MSTQQAAPLPIRLIKLKDVMSITGLSRSSIYRYIDEDQFPQQISLGERSVAWLESEVQGWVLNKVQQRDSLH